MRHAQQAYVQRQWLVSIHAPAWGATQVCYYHHRNNRFQSTHPHGVRLGSLPLSSAKQGFQSTHPHGVRHILTLRKAQALQFQSTHPHGVRHNSLSPFTPFFAVSIHAPAWGATFTFTPVVAMAAVSIHAPAWGATTDKIVAGQAAAVSIHAPAWGATSVTALRQYPVARFQSTHPHGVRLTCLKIRAVSRSFNPRTRMGCDGID